MAGVFAIVPAASRDVAATRVVDLAALGRR
jgi:hypothetical protein